MFNFGSPEQTYQLFAEQALAVSGPDVAGCPVDEMSSEELKVALTYSLMAYMRAKKQTGDEGVLAVAKSYFDEVWTTMIDTDEGFRQRFIRTPGMGVASTDRARYVRYAKGELSEL